MKNTNISNYRWVILFSIVPIIISTEMMWLSLAPISSMAEKFYGVDGFWITLFTMSYMIMFVIFSVPASWCNRPVRLPVLADFRIGTDCLFWLGEGIFCRSFSACHSLTIYDRGGTAPSF